MQATVQTLNMGGSVIGHMNPEFYSDSLGDLSALAHEKWIASLDTPLDLDMHRFCNAFANSGVDRRQAPWVEAMASYARMKIFMDGYTAILGPDSPCTLRTLLRVFPMIETGTIGPDPETSLFIVGPTRPKNLKMGHIFMADLLAPREKSAAQYNPIEWFRSIEQQADICTFISRIAKYPIVRQGKLTSLGANTPFENEYEQAAAVSMLLIFIVDSMLAEFFQEYATRVQSVNIPRVFQTTTLADFYLIQELPIFNPDLFPAGYNLHRGVGQTAVLAKQTPGWGQRAIVIHTPAWLIGATCMELRRPDSIHGDEVYLLMSLHVRSKQLTPENWRSKMDELLPSDYLNSNYPMLIGMDANADLLGSDLSTNPTTYKARTFIQVQLEKAGEIVRERKDWFVHRVSKETGWEFVDPRTISLYFSHDHYIPLDDLRDDLPMIPDFIRWPFDHYALRTVMNTQTRLYST